jgi:hypothetical protein
MIDVRTSNLADLSDQIGRRKSHIEMAMRRAAGSFVSLLRAYVLTEVRKRVGLPRAEMNRVRIRSRIVRNRLQASLWVGSNPVAVRYLNPRFGRKGITAGGKKYPLAFLPYKKRGSSLILQRVGNERLPVEVPRVDINDIVIEVLDREWGKLEAYFDKRVLAELATIDRRA